MSKGRIALVVSGVILVAASAALVIYLAGGTAAPVSEGSTASKPPADTNAVVARAVAGDHEAELQLGLWTLESAMRRPQYLEAEQWLRKAAEAGLAEAQFRLGTLYQSGRVSDAGNTNALFWFQKAAAQHHVGALFNLGSMYGTGQGVARDLQASARYFTEAAELGDAYAQFNMARRCAEGQGIPTNLVEGWKWYALSELGGISSAHGPKQALESQLTAAQLEQARRGVEEVRSRTAQARH
jgi:TPR repeat protein